MVEIGFSGLQFFFCPLPFCDVLDKGTVVFLPTELQIIDCHLHWKDSSVLGAVMGFEGERTAFLHIFPVFRPDFGWKIAFRDIREYSLDSNHTISFENRAVGGVNPSDFS